MGDDETEQVDRELEEFLEELRVAIPGAEVLFAFLLGVAFTQRFEDVTSLQRNVYFATLLLTAAATALLIAPSAMHRVLFRDGDRKQILVTGTHMANGGLMLLLLAISGVVFLVADVLYSAGVAVVTAGLTAAWFMWLWFALPLVKRRR